MEKNYTYLLQCADGSLYCGWTNCLKDRVHAHNTGKGAKYTRGRRPVKLVYYEEFATRKEAMQREIALKRLTRQQKLSLIRNAAVTIQDSHGNGYIRKTAKGGENLQ